MASISELIMKAHKCSKFESIDKASIEPENRKAFTLCTPVKRLEDHQGEISSCKFHPLGDLIMSSGFDKKIQIGGLIGDEHEVSMSMTGHTDSITDTQFAIDGSRIYSCSMDTTIAAWDTETGVRTNQLIGHEAGVNSVHSDENVLTRLCSGSDDATVRLWDTRAESLNIAFDSGYQVTATCFNKRGNLIITGGIDNDIKIWDIRNNEVIVGRLEGHVDLISSIVVSPCGDYLLSNSIDNTLRIWDIRPFAADDRCIDVYTSNQYVMEGNLLRCAWSRDGKTIAAGSSDNHVYIWDIAQHTLVYKLPGHQSSVIDVDFHPTEPTLLSGSSSEHLYTHQL